MVNYWDKYTEMHGQQNVKYTEMHGQQNVKKIDKDNIQLIWENIYGILPSSICFKIVKEPEGDIV